MVEKLIRPEPFAIAFVFGSVKFKSKYFKTCDLSIERKKKRKKDRWTDE